MIARLRARLSDAIFNLISERVKIMSEETTDQATQAIVNDVASLKSAVGILIPANSTLLTQLTALRAQLQAAQQSPSVDALVQADADIQSMITTITTAAQQAQAAITPAMT